MIRIQQNMNRIPQKRPSFLFLFSSRHSSSISTYLPKKWCFTLTCKCVCKLENDLLFNITEVDRNNPVRSVLRQTRDYNVTMNFFLDVPEEPVHGEDKITYTCFPVCIRLSFIFFSFLMFPLIIIHFFFFYYVIHF